MLGGLFVGGDPVAAAGIVGTLKWGLASRAAAKAMAAEDGADADAKAELAPQTAAAE